MDVIGQVERELRGLGRPERAEGEARYLKSDLVHFGVPLGEIRRVALAAVKPAPGRAETLALVTAFWAADDGGTPIHDMRMAAIEVLVRRTALLEPGDLDLVERLIRESRSWAYVDPLATKVAGGLVLREPSLAGTLDAWVGDGNFWIRRTSLLALLAGIRTGAPDLTRLARYGDALLPEKEFFIRKALGWVLRELSKRDPEWVRAWVAVRVGTVSGVTFREAVRHLPEDDRAALVAAYKAR